MRQSKIMALAAIAVSFFIGSGLALLLNNRATSFRFTVAIAVMAALFSFATVPFFLAGLKHFKAGLKRAYIFLCVGIALFGLAQAQIPIVNIFSLWFWLDSGAAAFVYIFGSICMFWSVRSFARLLQIKTVWTSALMCIAAIIVFVVPLAFLPHIKSTVEESMYDALLVLVACNVVLIGFAAATTSYIKRSIGAVYAKSILWLSVAFWTVVFAGLHFLVVRLLLTDGDWYFDYSLSILPFTIAALIFIKAGYEFNAISSMEEAGQAAGASTGRSDLALLDIITYAASLASRPKEVDVVLDEFRRLTVRLTPGSNLSEEDKRTLVRVYSELEAYLVTKEPLRVFTKDELRRRVIKKFGQNEIITAASKETAPDTQPTVPASLQPTQVS